MRGLRQLIDGPNRTYVPPTNRSSEAVASGGLDDGVCEPDRDEREYLPGFRTVGKRHDQKASLLRHRCAGAIIHPGLST